MALISFLGLFYVFLIISLFILYFREDDKWFKAFYFIGCLAVFILLVHYSYFQTQVDNDNYVINKLYTNGVDLNNLVYNSSHTYTVDTTYAVFNFWDIPSNTVFDKVNSEFCFNYANVDADPNVVVVVTGVDEISDYLYLAGSTNGTSCVHINTSFITHGETLGINCLDCSVANPFTVPQYNVDSSLGLYEVHITKSNPESYSLFNSGKIHAFWVNYYVTPVEVVEDNYWFFMRFLAVFIMMFIFRIIYNIVSENI